MMPSTVQTAAAVWVERYEALRRHFLGDPVLSARPLSLVLWLAHGMAGWMGHWKMENEGTVKPTSVLPPRSPAATTWQGQLTHLLAQMTSQHLQTSL
jgi:hypothetical protein